MKINAARAISLFFGFSAMMGAVSHAHAAAEVSCTAEGDCTRDLGAFTITGYELQFQSTVFQDNGGWVRAHPGLMTVESNDESGAVLSFDPDYIVWGDGVEGDGRTILLYMSNLSFDAKPGYRLNEVRITVEGEVRAYRDGYLSLYKLGSGLLGAGEELRLDPYSDTTVPFNISSALAPHDDVDGTDWAHYLVYATGDGSIRARISKVSYQVSVSAVPEASAWAMASVGMVLAGIAARRARRA